jgi:cold shock CspA family protein
LIEQADIIFYANSNMGKSKETFSKKENEKKRLKKQKEKAEKKEVRKANSNTGKSFEEMLAYVDENGNISDTPPDPKKKQVVRSEDMILGARKQEDFEEVDTLRKGTVTFYNDSKGFGFIKDHESQESVFVHANGLLQPIKEYDKVSFTVEKGQRGLMAVGVKLEK